MEESLIDIEVPKINNVLIQPRKDKELQIKNLYVSELLNNKSLTIPPYQRPYKWQGKHVLQLLEDILNSYNTNKRSYRIGTVLLHKENEKLNIVDGQQRLVTLTLILHSLNYEAPLLNSVFPHSDSKINIKQNYEYIKDWFYNLHPNQKTDFKEYILNNCEFITIELQDISEAFQLFDSQNARGKALEPYDLLKAFHLREMEDNITDEEKLICVKKWEKAANEGALNILGNYIYRIRKWAKGEDAGIFTKENIDEFKGINLNKYQAYPYLKSAQLNDAVINNISQNKIYQCLNSEVNYPFQLTQLIINGKRFFEFTHFYSELFANVFKKRNSEFKAFYKQHCHYDGSYRTGDTYVREMFEAAILFYLDKFGKADFEEAYKILFKWSYILRLQQSRVVYNSVDKYIRDKRNSPEKPQKDIFKKIHNSYHPNKLLRLKHILELPNKVEKSIEEIEKVFK